MKILERDHKSTNPTEGDNQDQSDAVDAPLGPFCTQLPAGALATGVPILCVSTPEDARLSLLAMVLLTMETLSESCNETPAPSHPAMLLTMMLLVSETLFQSVG